MATYVVFVRSMGQTHPVEVAVDGSVEDLYSAAAQFACPGATLTWSGRPLSDKRALLADLGICPESTLDMDRADVKFCSEDSMGVVITEDGKVARKASQARWQHGAGRHKVGEGLRYGIVALPKSVTPVVPGSTFTFHFKVRSISNTMAIAVGLAHPNVEEMMLLHDNGCGMIFADGPQGWACVDSGENINMGESGCHWGTPQGARWDRWEEGTVVSFHVSSTASGAEVSIDVDGKPQGVAFSGLPQPLQIAIVLEQPSDEVEIVERP
eukprot:TRINITY_DN5711_c0_g1_i4.p1 TRINITY_DN5711_c0_g1~~TRINITY_DN5711_c0_g1_i4.p1  ORF type:complete len:268 (+),score=24.73 TRINITY_DN5711_c0_g1_i4:72-875(+)